MVFFWLKAISFPKIGTVKYRTIISLTSTPIITKDLFCLFLGRQTRLKITGNLSTTFTGAFVFFYGFKR